MKIQTFSFVLLLFPQMAHAYVGPGAGLGAIAITIAVMFGLLLLVVGFVWYPIKRLLRKLNPKQKSARASGN